MTLFRCTIEGHLPRLENQRQSGYRKSKKALSYLHDKGYELNRIKTEWIKRHGQVFPLTGPLDITLWIWYKKGWEVGNAPDLSGELFYNFLQMSGVVENDRQFVIHTCLRCLGDPKVQCIIRSAKKWIEHGGYEYPKKD